MTRKLAPLVFVLCVFIAPPAAMRAESWSASGQSAAPDAARPGDTYQKLLADENFAAIENFASDLRSKKTRADDGLWMLSLMYQSVHLAGPEQLDADFEAELALMQKWKAAAPASITRPVVEAQILLAYAWKARGGGWASTVTDDGWKLFSERVERAKQILDDAAGLPSRCPHWYAAMQTVALAQGWPRATYENLFNQALQAEPSYETFYFKKATYLLPRWYGREGDAAAFAEEATRLHPAGAEIYARIVWSQHTLHKGEFFATSGYNWEKTRAGFDAMLAAWPANKNLQAFAYFACRAKDRELARDLFQKNNDTPPVIAVWRMSAYFAQCKRWALWQKKNPRSSIPAPKPIPMPTPAPSL